MPTAKLVSPNQNYPDEKLLPDDFEAFLAAGKEQIEIEYIGRKWVLATLEEYEHREYLMRLSQFDVILRARLMRVDVLTAAILQVTDVETGKQQDFSTLERKEMLRNALLKADEAVLEQLYNAYIYLRDRARENLFKTYGNLREKLDEGFFALSGESSNSSDTSPHTIQDSKK